jgi:hypothetical protein
MPLAMPLDPIPFPALPAQPSNPLPVPYVCQILTEWCWAACASMILQYYHQNVDKCDVASRKLNQHCCPANIFCNVPIAAECVVKTFDAWGLKSTASPGAVQPEILKNELAGLRPVELGLGPCPDTSRLGHLVVVYGFVSDTVFWVHDPHQNGGSGKVDYSYLTQGMGRGCWRMTWTCIAPKP